MAQEVATKRESRMPIRREEARDPYVALRERMDRVMDEFLGGLDVWPSTWAVRPFEWRMGAFTPSIDIRDEDNQIKIEAELPGLADKDVEITLSEDTLIITGEKKQEEKQKEKNYYRMERSYGSFKRTIPLPVDIDRDKVEAHFKNGVLDITLPKTKEAVESTKKIPIKAE